jgi:hypothetical protein
MRPSRKAMELFLRDLEVEQEIALRNYRNGCHHPDAAGEVKASMATLKIAKEMAVSAIRRTETHVPEDRMEFMAVVEQEARARALEALQHREMSERLDERQDNKPIVRPKSPSDLEIFEEVISMFHECALNGSFPEPRLPGRE